jgi:leader peptidase (prepilin peptidase) / N-methyltransferase
LFLFVLLGLAVGSFLNVVIDRLPAGGSLISPPSRCPGCSRRLSVSDLIPVVSYLVLRGRCRTCGSRIPARVLLMEIATGVSFGLLAWYFGPSPALAAVLFYFCLLLTISVIDLEHGLILNVLVFPGIIIALILSALATFTHLVDFAPSLAGSGIGGAVGFGLFLLIALLSRGGMGLGDVKMAALLGVMLGFPLIFVGIFLAIISGGLVAIGLLITRKKGRKQTIPFGPFLAIGGFAALLWGLPILDWYLRLFGFT